MTTYSKQYNIKTRHPVIKTVLYNILCKRRELGYSQQYMAIMLGVSQNAYNKLENGRVPVTMDRFFKIAELLDTPIEEFLTIKKKESGI